MTRIKSPAAVAHPGEQELADAFRDEVLSIHFGRSANCSSIGSMVDFLFVSTAVGAAVVSAVTIALARRGDQDASAHESSDHGSGETRGSTERSNDKSRAIERGG